MFKIAITILITAVSGASAFLILKRRLQAGLFSAERHLGELKEKHRDIFRFDENVLRENKAIETEILDVAQLYDLAREMGAALDFKELFSILLDRISRLFEFDTCKLLLIDAAEDKFSIYATYKSPSAADWKRGGGKVLEIPDTATYETDLADKMCKDESHKPVYITGGNLGAPGAKIPNGKTPYIAVPLISRNKMLGILAAEGFKGDNTDKFLILAGQFAIEIEKVRLYNEVQELAITDGLTNVFLRRHFFERFEEESIRSARHGLKLSLLMLDIDNFKALNDHSGHLVGDIILKDIAGLIKGEIREIDIVGRFGGEEFCVVLPETDKDGARLVAERIRERVKSRTFKAYDEELKSTISIGISSFPDDGKIVKDLVDNADKALYRSKREGKDRVSVCDG